VKKLTIALVLLILILFNPLVSLSQKVKLFSCQDTLSTNEVNKIIHLNELSMSLLVGEVKKIDSSLTIVADEFSQPYYLTYEKNKLKMIILLSNYTNVFVKDGCLWGKSKKTKEFCKIKKVK